MLIRNSPDLANYLEDLINTIASDSYLINKEGELIMANDQPPPTKSKEFLKVFKQHFKLFSFTYRQNSDNLVFLIFLLFFLFCKKKTFEDIFEENTQKIKENTFSDTQKKPENEPLASENNQTNV